MSVRGPYPGFADPFIHEVDVASVLARALLDDSLAGQKISITGPQSVTHAEMVSTIGEVIGRAAALRPDLPLGSRRGHYRPRAATVLR